MTFSLDVVAEPLHVPPRVALTATDLDPDVLLQSVKFSRNGVPVRFDAQLTGDEAVAYDYEAPFDALLTYRADAAETGALVEWTETWASLAAWTGSGWSAGSGIATSTTPSSVIRRDTSARIIEMVVTSPANLKLELTTADDDVIVSVLVSPDGTVTLAGTTATKVTGSGSFTLTLAASSASIVGTGWSATVPISTTPATRVRLVAPLTATYMDQFTALVPVDGGVGTPRGMAIDSGGGIWVADDTNHQVIKYSSAGVYQSRIGGGLGAGNADGQFDSPQGIAIDGSDNVWVADSGNHRVQVFDSAGTFLFKFGTSGTGNGQFDTPIGIDFDSGGNPFVVDSGNNRVQKFNSSGVYQSQFGSFGSGNGQFTAPVGIAIGASDNMWVVDSVNNRVQKFNSSGVYQSQFGTFGSDDGEFFNPQFIAIDGSANLWVTDLTNERVQKFSSAGAYQAKFGTLGGGNGQFALPTGIVIIGDAMWVADAGGRRVQKFWLAPGTTDDVATRVDADTPVDVTATDTATLSPSGATAGAWLVNSLIPDLALRLAPSRTPDDAHSILATTRAETSLISNAISLPIEGSADILTVTIGPRGRESWNLDILCRNQAARNELLAIMANNAVINLRFPPGVGGGLTDGFYAVGDLSPSRLGLPSSQTGHVVSLPLTPARAPKFTPLWQWDIDAVAQTGMSIDDVAAAFSTITDLLIGPN